MAKLGSRRNIFLIAGLALMFTLPIGINYTPGKGKPAKAPSLPPKDEADLLVEKAAMDYFYRSYPAAIANYQKAIDLQTARGNLRQAANLYESIGDTYKAAQDNAAAERQYLKARECHAKNQNKEGEASALKRIGDMEMESENFDAAVKWYEEALIQARQNEKPNVTLARVQESLGRYYWQSKNIPRAAVYITGARESFAAINDPLGYEHMNNILLRMDGKGGKLHSHAVRPSLRSELNR